MEQPEVQTLAGRVRGVAEEGVDAFLGIPYAQPPVGELRWQAARPHPGWDGVLDAAEYGPFAPQPRGSAFEQISGPPRPFETSEDCLTLNVWRPSDAEGPLPVLVWIHGGGFMFGSGNMLEYAGDRFARNGNLVVVTINYRLGPYGYLHGMGDTPNLWLSDQALAIRWVHENIARFGGDPESVTLMGQSAGALSIGALVQHPLARGLFQRAILESGPFGLELPSPAEALARTEHLAQVLGHDSIEALRDEPEDRLLGGMIQVLIDYAVPGQWALAFLPVLDPDTLPVHPVRALMDADIDLLVGWTEDEATFAFAPDPRSRHVSEQDAIEWIGLAHRDPEAVYRLYAQGNRGESPFTIVSAVCSDDLYRRAGADLVRHRSTTRPAFAYELRLDSRAMGGDLGSNHCFELPFVFDNADRWLAPSQMDNADPVIVRRVSDAMHSAWIAFVATGDAGTDRLEWPRYDARSQKIVVFDETIAIAEDALQI